MNKSSNLDLDSAGHLDNIRHPGVHAAGLGHVIVVANGTSAKVKQARAGNEFVYWGFWGFPRQEAVLRSPNNEEDQDERAHEDSLETSTPAVGSTPSMEPYMGLNSRLEIKTQAKIKSPMPNSPRYPGTPAFVMCYWLPGH
ncbi:uncharacterized protein LOC144302711 [Canis aureus]